MLLYILHHWISHHGREKDYSPCQPDFLPSPPPRSMVWRHSWDCWAHSGSGDRPQASSHCSHCERSLGRGKRKNKHSGTFTLTLKLTFRKTVVLFSWKCENLVVFSKECLYLYSTYIFSITTCLNNVCVHMSEKDKLLDETYVQK